MSAPAWGDLALGSWRHPGAGTEALGVGHADFVAIDVGGSFLASVLAARAFASVLAARAFPVRGLVGPAALIGRRLWWLVATGGCCGSGALAALSAGLMAGVPGV